MLLVAVWVRDWSTILKFPKTWPKTWNGLYIEITEEFPSVKEERRRKWYKLQEPIEATFWRKKSLALYTTRSRNLGVWDCILIPPLAEQKIWRKEKFSLLVWTTVNQFVGTWFPLDGSLLPL